MDGVKWCVSENSEQYSFSTSGDLLPASVFESNERITFDDAIRENLVEVVQTDHYNGMPQFLITNNSSWKIILLQRQEYFSKRTGKVAELTITLQHNARAIIPAFFLANSFLGNHGNSSIQDSLNFFKTTETQVGLNIYMDDRLVGSLYGEFPMLVEMRYTRKKAADA